jgi:prepilin-type N-terminal cleavage/methylation domain-containing protein
MIRRKLRALRRQQAGFTIIETVVGLLIAGIISLGATMSNAQVLKETSFNSDYTTASQHNLNAIQWISQDTQMSQTIITSGNSGFPLTLEWVAWNNIEYQVVYTITDNQLRREYSVQGGTPVQTTIAEYINDDDEMTYCSSDNGVLTLKVTASVGRGVNILDITRTREITSRPNL